MQRYCSGLSAFVNEFGFGYYEVDTIVGAAHSQHILTLNDRKTGKVWLRKLQNPTAAEAADQIIGILECLKQYDLVKTITADNGLQFAEHEHYAGVSRRS